MASKNFSEIEIDAIGEIMNISLGASATAVSTMLDTRVDITTPTVRVVDRHEFTFSNLQPAVGVEITYISGLDGKNVMLLKRRDVRIIIELLMGMEIPDEEFELDEMNISAICEVMNQMMGASSTALSEFLGEVVNISTPTSFEIENEEEFKDIYFVGDEKKVVIGFTLNIDGKMESEFVNVMSADLAKELVRGFLPEEAISEEEAPQEPAQPEIPAQPQMSAPTQPGMVMPDMSMPMQQPVMQAQPAASAPQSVPDMGMPMMQQPVMQAQPAAPAPQPMPVQPAVSNEAMLSQQLLIQQMMQQMQQMQEQIIRMKEQENKVLGIKGASHPELNVAPALKEEQADNLELVMGVPLEVSVEIGRTQSLVKDILEYTKGTLVVLDRQAGDQVDLFVNGQCIARGDVVVVDDNFGIRITEILKRPELM